MVVDRGMAPGVLLFKVPASTEPCRMQCMCEDETMDQTAWRSHARTASADACISSSLISPIPRPALLLERQRY